MTIRNPAEWGMDQWKTWSQAVVAGSHAAAPAAEHREPPVVRKIGTGDLRDALAQGFRDFVAYRTDILALCLVYPVAGLVLAQVVFERDMLQLLFPLASGFALVGPFAAIGLHEMSRRREQGQTIPWADAFAVLRSPASGAIFAMGLILMVVFLAWLFAAQAIYMMTLGPQAPVSNVQFLHDVFTTGAGWAMIVLGVGVGFLFAVLVLTISVVTFPMLIDRHVGVATAMRTSVRAVRENPRTMAVWGMIVAGGLVLGSLPLFVGLALVMPVLGHGTWHLYRRLVP